MKVFYFLSALWIFNSFALEVRQGSGKAIFFTTSVKEKKELIIRSKMSSSAELISFEYSLYSVDGKERFGEDIKFDFFRHGTSCELRKVPGKSHCSFKFSDFRHLKSVRSKVEVDHELHEVEIFLKDKGTSLSLKVKSAKRNFTLLGWSSYL